MSDIEKVDRYLGEAGLFFLGNSGWWPTKM